MCLSSQMDSISYFNAANKPTITKSLNMVSDQSRA